MIFFHGPQPCRDDQECAVKMAIRMREKMEELTARWETRGFDLDFGVGIATGAANMGMTGFDGRQDYSAIGPVINIAARLSGSAGAGQILITNRVLDKVGRCVDVESLGDGYYKEFFSPVAAFNVLGDKP